MSEQEQSSNSTSAIEQIAQVSLDAASYEAFEEMARHIKAMIISSGPLVGELAVCFVAAEISANPGGITQRMAIEHPKGKNPASTKDIKEMTAECLSDEEQEAFNAVVFQLSGIVDKAGTRVGSLAAFYVAAHTGENLEKVKQGL